MKHDAFTGQWKELVTGFHVICGVDTASNERRGIGQECLCNVHALRPETTHDAAANLDQPIESDPTNSPAPNHLQLSRTHLNCIKMGSSELPKGTRTCNLPACRRFAGPLLQNTFTNEPHLDQARRRARRCARPASLSPIAIAALTFSFP